MRDLSKNTSTFLFTLLTSVLIVIAFISYKKINKFNESVEAVMHTNLVKSKVMEVGANLKDANIGQRGFLLTNDSTFFKPFENAEKYRNVLFASLDSLISDNPSQQENISKLKQLVDERYAMYFESLKLSKNSIPDPAINVALNSGREKTMDVQKQIKLIIQAEDDLLRQRTAVKDRSATFTPIFLLGLSVFSIGIITFFFFRLQKETSERISITESNILLQEAKQKIEASETRFRMLTESIPHMIWKADADGNKNFFNQYFFDYTGMSFEELKGDGMLKIIHPADIEKDLKLWKHSLKTGDDFIIEKRIKRHDGTYRWHISRAIAQKDSNGNITEWIGSSTDIEYQKKIVEVLEKEEEQFRTFANSIQNLAWIADGNGWVYWFNQKWFDYTGTTLDEMEGWGWIKVHHPDYILKVNDFFKEAWKKDESIDITFPLRRHDGEYRWFQTHAFPVKNANGTIERWVGTNTDITEQKFFTEELELKVKERTAELEERKNFVETILETSKEYVVVFANDFTVIDINSAAEKMMGRKKEDLIGKKLQELMPNAKGSKSESDLQSAFEGINIHNQPFQSSITGMYIENYITPLKDKDGNVYAAIAIATDVTNIIVKQKEIETANEKLIVQNQMFELAESIAKFGSYKWDMTAGTLEYSDNLFRLLDYDPQEFIPTYEKFLSFIHPDDLQQVIENGEQTMHSKEIVDTPFRIISKKGIIKYFRTSGSFSGTSGNDIMIGTMQDISKDITASRELKTKNLELENANAELASFTYVASHDLQEPLRKIQGFSKRILDTDGDKLSENTINYFNRIRGAAQRMQNLIESLLSFSRTNTTEIAFEETDLNLILDDVKGILQEKIKEKKAIIDAENLPTLSTEPIQMQQLFINLIANALKYSKPDVAPYIKITAEKVSINDIVGQAKQSGIFWKIVISDNGIGFEQQYEHKIFELFQRLHGKTVYEGTGIGLAICKKIVQSHKGSIAATGQLGVGSTFTIYLSDSNKS